MRRFLLMMLVMFIAPIAMFGQAYKKHTVSKEKLKIALSEGILSITPLTDISIRIQWQKALPPEEKEFVLIHKPASPVFKIFPNITATKIEH